MLRKIRKAGMWGYTDVSDDVDGESVIHFWFKKGHPPEHVARLIGHELGHISGGGPFIDIGAKEEERADEYSRVAWESVVLMRGMGLIP